MQKLISFVQEHPFKCAAIFLILVLLALAYGCQPKTTSVINPPQRVDKYELKAEMELIVTQFETKFDNIAQQEELRNALFAAAGKMYTTGTVDPYGVALTLAGILGFGAVGDDVRLRRRIKRSPDPTATV